MKTQDFSTELLVSQTPEEVFKAILNIRGWWSENIEGDTEHLNSEFIYNYKDLHYSKQKLVELIPNKKATWHVTDSSLNFVKNKKEWDDTKFGFDISKDGNKTKVTFTHFGLLPNIECFDACSGGWNYYLHESLFPLITKGKGQPDKKATKSKTKV
jgi:hypothetical protein